MIDALSVDDETVRKNVQCLTTNKFKILVIKKQVPESSQSDVEMIDTA